MLRKLLITTAMVCVASGAAFAADLPYQKAPPIYAPPPPPAFTWTGVYLGGQVGYQWGTSRADLYTDGAFFGGLPVNRPSGIVGGAHVGYNYQVSQFVFGVEGDVDGLDYRSSNNFPGFLTSFTTREDIDGSVRGRVGVAWDRVLFYGTGGVAFGNFQNTFTGVNGGYDSFSTLRTGWTAGAGIEYAVTNNWSIRAEYRYTDFGHFDNYLTNSAPGDFFHNRATNNSVKAGFSYKFDTFSPLPVAAKY